LSHLAFAARGAELHRFAAKNSQTVYTEQEAANSSLPPALCIAVPNAEKVILFTVALRFASFWYRRT
jgi:hypothetical protein